MLRIVNEAVEASNKFTGRQDQTPLVLVLGSENSTKDGAYYQPSTDLIAVNRGELSLSDEALSWSIAHELGHRDDRDRGVHLKKRLENVQIGCGEQDLIDLSAIVNVVGKHTDSYGSGKTFSKLLLTKFKFEESCVEAIVEHFKHVASVDMAKEIYADKFTVDIGKPHGIEESLAGSLGAKENDFSVHFPGEKRIDFVQKLVSQREQAEKDSLNHVK